MEDDLSDGPSKKDGCGMVAFEHSNNILLFGGWCILSGHNQSGANYTYVRDGKGYTNEIHIFSLKEGEDDSAMSYGQVKAQTSKGHRNAGFHLGI